MNTKILMYALGGAVLLVAIGAGAWYFVAPPKEAAVMQGSISGRVMFPSDGVPPLRVCAVPKDGPDSAAVCVETKESPPAPTDFKIGKLPPGDYFVYAQIKDPTAIGTDIPADFKAYYDQFVVCGLKFDCKDTTRIIVHVNSGADTPDILPHDWYR